VRVVRQQVGAFLLILVSCAAAAAQTNPADFFPLSKGTYWVYDASLDWTVVNTSPAQFRHSHIRWKMEVVETYSRGDMFVAILKGGPWDLSWYEPGQEHGQYVMVRAGNSFYLLPRPGAETLEKLRSARGFRSVRDDLADWIWFRVPMHKGDQFKDSDYPPERNDGMYCSVVEHVRKRRLRGIKGVDAATSVTSYQLAYRTMPDHEISEIVPGVGIVTWRYSHHGTLAEADLRLVAFGNAATRDSSSK
jgi:hypothetical protein